MKTYSIVQGLASHSTKTRFQVLEAWCGSQRINQRYSRGWVRNSLANLI